LQLVERSSDLIQRHFVGPSFDDKLYRTDNNAREKACAWKIMRSPYFHGLTQDSWYWGAVNILLDLVDKSQMSGCPRYDSRGEELIMKAVLIRMLLLQALCAPALAHNNQGQNNSKVRGALGPLMGAGLPVLTSRLASASASAERANT